MALTAKLDATLTTLTVVSDKRKVSGTVTVGGETANYSAFFEPVVKDDSGRTWVKKSDDGTTTTYV